MTTTFKRHELPMAYSMIAAAKRIRPRRDGRHPFDQYFLYWTAFNSIYTTIAHRKGHKTRIKKDTNGSIVTITNGNVIIPEVVIAGESEQLRLVFEDIADDLKHSLILHQGTKYFVGRTPFWGGLRIENDAFGQRVNGVINVNYTTDNNYPVWSPIDIQYFEAYVDNPDNDEIRDFLGRQIIDLLYTIRLNLMHFGTKFDDANDINVVEKALPMLILIVNSFTQ